MLFLTFINMCLWTSVLKVKLIVGQVISTCKLFVSGSVLEDLKGKQVHPPERCCPSIQSCLTVLGFTFLLISLPIHLLGSIAVWRKRVRMWCWSLILSHQVFWASHEWIHVRSRLQRKHLKRFNTKKKSKVMINPEILFLWLAFPSGWW